MGLDDWLLVGGSLGVRRREFLPARSICRLPRCLCLHLPADGPAGALLARPAFQPLQAPCAATPLPTCNMQTQMAKGFARVESRLEDIALDSPRAPELYPQFKAQAAEGGWLVAAA